MKKITILLFLFSLSQLGFTQIQVTTITNSFKGSGGLSLDSAGNLFVGDFGDFLGASNPGGALTNIWVIDKQGHRNLSASGFVGASGNAFNSQGVLFQADIRGGAVYYIDSARKKQLYTQSLINQPVGLTFDAQGNLYVCNCGNNTIAKVAPDTTVSILASGSMFACPNGITIDHKGNLYVSNFSGPNNLVKITSSGQTSVFASIPGSNNGHLDFFAPDSVFYVASHGSSRIWKLDYQGNIIDTIGDGSRGNTDGDKYNSSFSRPNGIVISQTGDTLYVNSSVPTTNTPNRPLNPSLIRMVYNLKGLSPVGLKENHSTQNQLKVFPSPADEEISIVINESSNCELWEIQVLDSTGKMVFNSNNLCQNWDGNKLNITIKEWKSGSYQVHLKLAENHKTASFVKK